MVATLVSNIGGTWTRVGIVADGELVAEAPRFPTNPEDYWATLGQLAAVGMDLVRDSNIKVAAVGMAIAVHMKAGVVTGSGNLPDFKDRVPVRDIQELFQLPTTAEGDCQDEAHGEAVAHGRSLIYVGIGTGIGVGVARIDNGVVTSASTELGHLVMDRSGKYLCGCKGVGHAEALMGGAHLPGRFGVKSVEELTDDHWIEIIDDVAALCISVAAAYPDLPIVLGGTVAGQITGRPDRMKLLRGVLDTLESPVETPELLMPLLDESALIGASYAALQLVM